MKNTHQIFQDTSDNIASISDSVYYFPSKFFMWMGVILGSVSYLEIKEDLQFFCLIGGTISVTLSIILYVLKIWEKRINIKRLTNEIKKNCKP